MINKDLNATQKWIEEFRNWLEKETEKEINDKDIYNFLEIKSSAFSRYKRGDRALPEETAIDIAHYMQVPVMKILCEINADKTENKEIKKNWENLAKNAVAGIASIGFIGLMLTPETNIQAKITEDISTQQSIHYTKLAQCDKKRGEIQ